MAESLMSEPGEIFAARQQSTCIGQEVDWALRLAESHEEPAGYARVLLRSRPHEVKYVAATVPLADYPWIVSLRYGQPVQVHGLIAGIGKMSIELAGASLLQLSEAAR